MASTDTGKGYDATLVASPASKQVVRKKITDLISSNFQATLGKEFDIINLFMSLVQRESSFNPNSRGPAYGESHFKTLMTYSAVKTVYDKGTAQERANIVNSAAAFGLTQVTGYYIIKGAGPSGTAELSRLRPDLASPLIVNPGVDVATVLLGPDNVEKQLLAGLIVLEGKYKSKYVDSLLAKGIFNNRLTAAISAYLGAIGSKDSIGTSPEVYANQIIRGSNYQIANNGRAPDGSPLIAGSGSYSPNTKYPYGPNKTVASGTALHPPGC